MLSVELFSQPLDPGRFNESEQAPNEHNEADSLVTRESVGPAQSTLPDARKAGGVVSDGRAQRVIRGGMGLGRRRFDRLGHQVDLDADKDERRNPYEGGEDLGNGRPMFERHSPDPHQ